MCDEGWPAILVPPTMPCPHPFSRAGAGPPPPLLLLLLLQIKLGSTFSMFPPLVPASVQMLLLVMVGNPCSLWIKCGLRFKQWLESYFWFLNQSERATHVKWPKSSSALNLVMLVLKTKAPDLVRRRGTPLLIKQLPKRTLAMHSDTVHCSEPI